MPHHLISGIIFWAILDDRLKDKFMKPSIFFFFFSNICWFSFVFEDTLRHYFFRKKTSVFWKSYFLKVSFFVFILGCCYQSNILSVLLEVFYRLEIWSTLNISRSKHSKQSKTVGAGIRMTFIRCHLMASHTYVQKNKIKTKTHTHTQIYIFSSLLSHAVNKKNTWGNGFPYSHRTGLTDIAVLIIECSWHKYRIMGRFKYRHPIKNVQLSYKLWWEIEKKN